MLDRRHHPGYLRHCGNTPLHDAYLPSLQE
jgi:hypothetical protein